MPVTPLVAYSHSQTGNGAIISDTKMGSLKKLGMLAESSLWKIKKAPYHHFSLFSSKWMQLTRKHLQYKHVFRR